MGKKKHEAEAVSFGVGHFDLGDFEIIDAHLHPGQLMTLSASYAGWNDNFVEALLPNDDFEGKAALRAKLSKAFEKHLSTIAGTARSLSRSVPMTP